MNHKPLRVIQKVRCGLNSSPHSFLPSCTNPTFFVRRRVYRFGEIVVCQYNSEPHERTNECERVKLCGTQEDIEKSKTPKKLIPVEIED